MRGDKGLVVALGCFFVALAFGPFLDLVVVY